MMQFDESIFKAYDIRGTFPDKINRDVAKAIGQAFAEFLPKGGVAVGRDARLGSDELAVAFIEGLVDQGRQVIDIGLVTTDMMYFSSGFYDLAGAAMITASHNPGRYNGLKLCGNQSAPIGMETGLEKIKHLVSRAGHKSAPEAGRVERRDLTADWLNHALSFVDASTWPPYQIAIDAGNGMAGPVVQALQQRLNLKVHGLFLEPDGNFPNHSPDPSDPANLADLVSVIGTHKMDLGIAFDGDGDRAVFVDELGRPVSPSIVGTILARRFLEQEPGGTIMYDLTMNRVLPETVAASGGKAMKTPVGGGYIRPAIRKLNAILACEASGHYYYRDNYYSDSGLITAVLMIQILAQSGQKLSQLVEPFIKYADSGEINLTIGDARAVIKRVSESYRGTKQDRLDGLTVDGGDWWFNVRASNTEPLLRINVEAASATIMAQRRDELLALIKQSA